MSDDETRKALLGLARAQAVVAAHLLPNEEARQALLDDLQQLARIHEFDKDRPGEIAVREFARIFEEVHARRPRSK